MQWAITFREYLSLCEANIIQMPCPESSFPSYDKGMNRATHGIKYYKELIGFREHCKALAEDIVQLINGMWKIGYNNITIIGVEHSPTCAVNYIYTHQGVIHSKGIFFQEIGALLEQKQITVSYIGINRRYYKKAVHELDELLHV